MSKKTKQLPDQPDTISNADASALEWYLGEGSALFERSPFGAMLERSKLLGEASDPCRDCCGKGIIESDSPRLGSDCKNHRESCDYCVGRKIAIGCWCSLCRGTGFTSRRIKGDPIMTMVLKKQTRFIEPSRTPEDWALTRYAVVSRHFDRLAKISKSSLTVIATYHGDKGARWADTSWGRIFVLLPLTNSGKQLLKREGVRRFADDGTNLSEALGVMAELCRKDPASENSKLFAEALDQAWSMYRKACLVWNLHRDADGL